MELEKPRGRVVAVTAALAVVAAVGGFALTAGGAGDPSSSGHRPAPAALTSSPAPTPPEDDEPEPAPVPVTPDAGSPLPTLPPGDPGVGPSVPEDTVGVQEPHGQPLTDVPPGALLDPETVGAVLGGSWSRGAPPVDSCAAPRPRRAVGSRTGALTATGGTVVETVATHHEGEDEQAVADLAGRLRSCGWKQEAEPPLGGDSAELSRSTPAGPERVVVVTAEGVSVTLVGRGSVAQNADDWAALVDVAVGTSCVAAPDGCH